MNLPAMLKSFRTATAKPTSHTVLATDPADGLPPPAAGAIVDPIPQTGGVMFRHLMSRDDGTKDAGLWAAYVLTGIDSQFVTPESRAEVMADQAFRWADQSGRRFWLRGTTAPFPVEAYAQWLERRDPGREVPEGARTHADLVAGSTGTLVNYDSKSPLTVIMIQIHETPVPADKLPILLTSGPLDDADKELADPRRQLNTVSMHARQAGFAGLPCPSAVFRWMTHSSVALGCPVPPIDTAQDNDESWAAVGGFTSGARATASEYALSTTVSVTRDLSHVQRSVVVQAVEKFGDRDLRRDPIPWLAWISTLNDPQIGPVDYVVIGEIESGDSLTKTAQFQANKVAAAEANVIEVGEQPTRELERAVEHSRDVEDEIKTGTVEVATRFSGVVLLAVSGEDEDDACDRARQLRLFAAREQKLTLSSAYAQYSLYRAFTPGAPETASKEVTAGFRTRQPVAYLATGVPNAYATGGDRVGFPVGPVGGSTEVYLLDPIGGPARNESGLTVVIAEQGAGKSYFAGAAFIDWPAAVGVRTVFVDPAGQFKRIAAAPHNRGDSYVYNLRQARAGVAVPSLLIPDPLRAEYPIGTEFADALASAKQARIDTTLDSLTSLIPYRVLMSDRGGDIVSAIEEIVGEHGGAYGTDPWELVARLEQAGTTASSDAAKLLTVRAALEGRLFFPEPGTNVDDREIGRRLDNALMTGISLEGIQVPQAGTPRELWSRDEQRAAPLMLVASLLAMRCMYADRQPKVITLDEVGILAASGAQGGASPLVMRAGAESRKYGATVVVLGQTPDMFTSMGDQIDSQVGTAIVGRLGSVSASRAGCVLLGLSPDSGHDATLRSLGQGEFCIRRSRPQVQAQGVPTFGRQDTVRRVYVDPTGWHEHLLAALDTTPEGKPGHDDLHSLPGDVLAGVS